MRKLAGLTFNPMHSKILGGEIFFYCTLKALLEVSKKALTNKNYKFPKCLDWKEAIVSYLIYETMMEKQT